MNEHAILNEIERLPGLSSEERRLLCERQFLGSLWRVVRKISKNNLRLFAEQVHILLNSLLRRYRVMVRLKAREARANEKLFLQLLRQKMRDNFASLDRSLRKFKLRRDLRKPSGRLIRRFPGTVRRVRQGPRARAPQSGHSFAGNGVSRKREIQRRGFPQVRRGSRAPKAKR